MAAPATPSATPLRVAEIFHSLQGETQRVGLRTVFVRLSGCPLRCTWCDTEYAFSGGEPMSEGAVTEAVAAWQTPHVCVTGGEPLAQKGALSLLRALADAGYDVSLETSGALDIDGVDPRVAIVMDLKAPASGECARNGWHNLALLDARDEIKIAIANADDYAWAVEQLQQRRLDQVAPVLFSPVAGQLAPATLAEWILRDRLPVRFQMQLHKVLWAESRGR